MNGSTQRFLFGVLIQVAFFAQLPLLVAADEPSIAQLAAAGRATLDRLQRDAVTWKATFESQDPSTVFQVTTIQSPKGRNILIEAVRAPHSFELARIIERDNVWYVKEEGEFGKYRPYEAPLLLPLLYSHIARSDLHLILDETPLGEFESMRGTTARYRVPLPAALKPQIEQGLKALELSKKGGDSENVAVAERLIPQLREALELGIAVEIDVENGIAMTSGGLGQRTWTKDFRWLPADGVDHFAVDASAFTDHTAPIADKAASPDDLLLIGHAGSWRPGSPAHDTDTKLVNIANGEMRRIPFPFGVSSTACFAKDRKSVFLTGHMPDEGATGLFQIDLATGGMRRLGQNLLTGISLFPTLSPDGNTIALVNRSGNEPDPLQAQICLVDVTSGEARRLGDPLDTAAPSWLPDGSGLVITTREYPDLSKPSIDTISRMGLDGTVTPIRKGEEPAVLRPYQRIVYRHPDEQRWKLCDLKGKDVTVIGDGLADFHFPAPSPNGRQLIMMSGNKTTGPRPYLVDIATGDKRPLPVGDGLWVLPNWR
jgi:hypothetical protein